MIIIYLVQYFPPEKASGLQLVEDLLEGFAKYKWKVCVFTPTPTRGVTNKQRKEYAKKRIEEKFDGNLIIRRMHLYREGRSFFARALRYMIFSIECFWKAVTVPADFIFTGSGPPTQGVVVGLAKKISHKKVIYNLQDIFPDSLITSGICNEDSILIKIGCIIENFTYRNADHIITITDDMKKNVVKKGVSPEKVSVIRNWIDVNKIVPIAPKSNTLIKELGLPENKFYVVYAGNLGKVQGVDVLVRAAEKLKLNKDIQFIIFGNGSEEDKIRTLIDEQRLDNISLYPLQSSERISEVYSLGNVCVISCKPGTGESGMPSKTWTIMATGTPIIASFDLNSEMEKTISEAKCGICVNSGEPEALAKAICEISMNPELAMKMGENARQYVVEQASKEKAVQKYIECIEKIMKV